jgi:formylmethanofuran dehydrogenase subunit A
MIRYSFFVLTVMATAATAIAAVHPAGIEAASTGRNVTVIEKNSPFPVVGPIVVEECAVEDCSDVQS